MGTSLFYPQTATSGAIATKTGNTGSLAIYNSNDVSRTYNGSYLTQGPAVGFPSISETIPTLPSQSAITVGLIPWDSNTKYLDNFYQEAYTGVLRCTTGSAVEYGSNSYGFSGGATDGIIFPEGCGSEARANNDICNTIMFWGKFPDLNTQGGAQDTVWEVRDLDGAGNNKWFRLKTITGGLRFQGLNYDGTERTGQDIQPNYTGSWACYLMEWKKRADGTFEWSMLDKLYSQTDVTDFGLIQNAVGVTATYTWGAGATDDTVLIGYGGDYDGGNSLYSDCRLGAMFGWTGLNKTAGTSKEFRDEIFNATKAYYQ